jgi:hypothetical protein
MSVRRGPLFTFNYLRGEYSSIDSHRPGAWTGVWLFAERVAVESHAVAYFRGGRPLSCKQGSGALR